jgi:hypothetical protein
MRTAMSATPELPKYKCHKEVWALKIQSIDQSPADEVSSSEYGTWRLIPEDPRYAYLTVPHAYVQRHNPQPGGYYVRYADGYESYSPAEAFESGYRLIAADQYLSVSADISQPRYLVKLCFTVMSYNGSVEEITQLLPEQTQIFSVPVDHLESQHVISRIEELPNLPTGFKPLFAAIRDHIVKKERTEHENYLVQMLNTKAVVVCGVCVSNEDTAASAEGYVVGAAQRLDMQVLSVDDDT